jgi:hypothetical protein
MTAPFPRKRGVPTTPGRRQSAFARAAAEPPLANLAASVLISPERNNRPALRRNGRFSGSSGGKRRPEPHGHKSFRPSFSTSSVSTPTIRLPRLTRDSLEGTPGGACQTAQKDVSVSWSRYMIVLLVTQSRRIVACEAQVPRAVFHRSGHPVTVALPAAMSAHSPCEILCINIQTGRLHVEPTASLLECRYGGLAGPAGARRACRRLDRSATGEASQSGIV